MVCATSMPDYKGSVRRVLMKLALGQPGIFNATPHNPELPCVVTSIDCVAFCHQIFTCLSEGQARDFCELLPSNAIELLPWSRLQDHSHVRMTDAQHEYELVRIHPYAKACMPLMIAILLGAPASWICVVDNELCSDR
jgi:hypothetical protein